MGKGLEWVSKSVKNEQEKQNTVPGATMIPPPPTTFANWNITDREMVIN